MSALDRSSGAVIRAYSSVTMLLTAGLFITSFLLSCQPTDNESNPPGLFPLGLLDRLTRLSRPQSKPINTKPQLAGKTLVINYWATWCKPCRDEMPSLQRLSDQFTRQPFELVGISVDQDERLASEFLLQHDIRFLNLLDPKARQSETTLKITRFPLTLVVAPDARILARVEGAREWSLALLQQLLDEAGHE